MNKHWKILTTALVVALSLASFLTSQGMDVAPDSPLKKPVVSSAKSSLSPVTTTMKQYIRSGHEILITGDVDDSCQPLFICEDSASKECKLIYYKNQSIQEHGFDTFKQLFGFDRNQVFFARSDLKVDPNRDFMLLLLCIKLGEHNSNQRLVYAARALKLQRQLCESEDCSCYNCVESEPCVVSSHPSVRFLGFVANQIPCLLVGKPSGNINAFAVWPRKFEHLGVIPREQSATTSFPWSMFDTEEGLIFFKEQTDSKLSLCLYNIFDNQPVKKCPIGLPWPRSVGGNLYTHIILLKGINLPWAHSYEYLTLYSDIRHTGRDGFFSWVFIDADNTGIAGLLNGSISQAYHFLFKSHDAIKALSFQEFLESIYPESLQLSTNSDGGDVTLDISFSISASELGLFKLNTQIPIDQRVYDICQEIKELTPELAHRKVTEDFKFEFQLAKPTKAFPTKRKFHWFSYDGAECPYWTLCNTSINSSTKRPIIYYVRGGPNTLKTDPSEGTIMSYLQRVGFFIVLANYPGSTFDSASVNLAEKKCLATSRAYYDRLHEGVVGIYGDAVDSKNVAIMGDSYGGLVAADFALGQAETILRQNLKACVALSPILTSNKGKVPFPEAVDYVYGSEIQSSPSERAHLLSRPLLIVQGKRDGKCLFEVTQDFCQNVKQAGLEKLLTCLSFEYGGHESRSPEELNATLVVTMQYLLQRLSNKRIEMGNLNEILDDAFAQFEVGGMG